MEIYLQACLISLIITTLALAYTAVRFPPEHKRLVVFRLGRFKDVQGPGLVFLIPFIDRVVEVDLQEQERRLSWEGKTEDESRVMVDLVLRYQVVDPAKSVLEVAHLEAFMEGMIGTVLRGMIGDMMRTDLIMNRKWIEEEVEKELRRKVRHFGTELEDLEIKEITML